MRARISTPLDQEMRRQGRQGTWLAAQVGASKSEVSRWRAGLHVPQQATREKIAVALGRTVGELFPFDDEQRAA